MAKGNFWTRSVRGRLGDMVFYKSNGEQMTRSYNGAPANPRTDKQLKQRIKWANICRAYDFFKPICAQSMIKRASDNSNFNTFVAENVVNSYLCDKTTQDELKIMNAALVCQYIVSKGNLSGYPSDALQVAFDESAGAHKLCVDLSNTDYIKQICDEVAEGGDTCSLSFDTFLKKYNALCGCNDSHIGVVLTYGDNGELPAFTKQKYLELWDNSIIENFEFSKNGASWKVADTLRIRNDVYVGVANNSGAIRLTFYSPSMQAGTVSAGTAFRCVRVPAPDCETSKLITNSVCSMMFEYISTADYINGCIASFRKGATADENAVFN